MFQGKMQLTSFLLISLAQYGALGAPVGAMESFVAQDGLHISSLGAPRTFDLFYPELPTLRPGQETSTAVPVIHLQENDEVETMEKAASDAYLEMFSQDLLDSKMKIRPIDVRIIEHDGFIDYEIEFVELSEEHDDDYNNDGHDNKDSSDKPRNDTTNIEVTTQKIATNIPVSTSTGVTAATFVDLLRRARRKHRQRILQETRVTTGHARTSSFNLETTQSNVHADSGLDIRKSKLPLGKTLYEKPRTNFQRRNRIKNKNKAGIRNLVKQRKRLSLESVSRNVEDGDAKKNLGLAKRLTKTGSFSTFKPIIWTKHRTSIHPKLKLEQEKKANHLNIRENSFVIEKREKVPKIIISRTSMPSVHKSVKSSSKSPSQESATLGDESVSMSSSKDSSTSTSISSYGDFTTSFSMPSSEDSPTSTSMPSYEDSPKSNSMASYKDSPTSTGMSSYEDSLASTSLPSYEDSPTTTSMPSFEDPHTSSTIPPYENYPTSTSMTSYEDSSTSTSMPSYEDSTTFTGMPSFEDSPTSTGMPSYEDSPTNTSMASYKDAPTSTSMPSYEDSPTSNIMQPYQESSASSSVSFLQESFASTSTLSNTESTSSSRMQPYQESETVERDNGKLVDNLGDIDLIVFDGLMEESVESVTKGALSDITTTLSLIEELSHQLKTISEDLKTNPSDNIRTPIRTKTTEEDQTVLKAKNGLGDFHLSEAKVNAELHNYVATPEVENEKQLSSKILIEDNNPAMQPITSATTTGSETSQPERSPKRINSKALLSMIIEESATLTGMKASQTVSSNEVIKGQYHELMPGKYHELNPGQYHERNPGQYHEVNPGHYHETTPGQYNRLHTAEDLGVKSVTVDFDHGDESRIYNVQANAGDFIIGEAGRIDINSGQTFQGVRYTAVEGEVDQARISNILETYFGARAR